MTIFSIFSLYFIYSNNVKMSQEFIFNQKNYIELQLQKEEKLLVAKEKEYIKKHAEITQKIIAQALLFNMSKKVVEDSTAILLKQKSIQAICVYDNIVEEYYLCKMKDNSQIIKSVQENDINLNLEFFLLPLEVSGNKFGYVKIYYDILPLIKDINQKIEKQKQKGYRLILEQERLINIGIKKHLTENIYITLFYLLAVMLLLGILLKVYVVNPLDTLYFRLYRFFDFLAHKKRKYKAIEIEGNDEFAQISKKVNENIETVLNIYHELEDTQKEIILTMGTIAEEHSRETSNHIKRVGYYSQILAQKYGLSVRESTLLKDISAMHDIGKISIPDKILNKPGRLTESEFLIMKDHPLSGYNILKHSNRPLLKAAAIIAYEHHEKYNGKGYPRGIKGDEIHIYGRIVALADVFDALGSDRIYKKAWSDEKIFAYIKEQRAKQFDPKLVDLFFENINDFLQIRDRFQDQF